MINVTLLDTVSGAADKTSNAYDLINLYRFAIQATLTGSNLVGTLKLQASLDNSTWIDVSGSSVSITASADQLWDVTAAGYRYVRAVWTYTSGAGNMTITMHIKDPVVTYG